MSVNLRSKLSSAKIKTSIPKCQDQPRFNDYYIRNLVAIPKEDDKLNLRSLKGRAKQQEVLPGTRFLSCSTCGVTFSTKSSSYSMCRGGLLQTLEYVKRGDSTRVWLLTMVLIFSLKLQTPLAISRRNCETTYQRFYLYWTIKLTDFFTDLHGIHMRGKGVSKYQSLENKRNWNWVDSPYAWKKFAKLEISPYPNSFTGNQNNSLKETQFS